MELNLVRVLSELSGQIFETSFLDVLNIEGKRLIRDKE
ncbi:unnamed protein product [Larinioides sclopetarius]|uniref:Uncharacterized protein n=1 Tax=Larinioides sclopetarius TaxID=280406 RepID=A0AAV1Z915_9ARAC